MVKEGKEASFWKVVDEAKKLVQCELCPHFCILQPGQTGKCHVRRNINGKLFSLVYGRPCSLALDPIEKKPLYHFLPGEQALSIATAGCNLRCSHCQNWEISQCGPEKIKSLEVKPEEVVKKAKEEGAKIISYTYTEPTIFCEYVLDISKIAKEAGVKNMTVTNGFINPEPLNQLCDYLDASNIDLKSIEEDFYESVCGAKLGPILESIKIMKKRGLWIELTTLLIPGLNDSDENINKLVTWIKKNLGRDVPLHFSAFYPTYKLTKLPPTSAETLKRARKIAMSAGLNYVYTGNIQDDEGNNTYCPKCKEIIIKRSDFTVIKNNIKKGQCEKCGEEIAGVWE